MSRDDAVLDAAFFGLIGISLVAVGSIAASKILSSVRHLLPGAALAVPVWALFVFFGMHVLAKGMYIIVEDASSP